MLFTLHNVFRKALLIIFIKITNGEQVQLTSFKGLADGPEIHLMENIFIITVPLAEQ
jgi:hypothetical protein